MEDSHLRSHIRQTTPSSILKKEAHSSSQTWIELHEILQRANLSPESFVGEPIHHNFPKPLLSVKFQGLYRNCWFLQWIGLFDWIFSLLRFTFGYDNSTGTYKVVLLSSSEVKVFSLSDNIWRKISSFPPFDHAVTLGFSKNEGVYLSGTVNWFALRSKSSYNKDITVEQFMIISLDLGTETYKQFQTPRGVDEVPYVAPTIAVLMDRLCFSHYIKRTHFVIWHMSEFGVEQSWTQFIKISFQNVQVDDRFRFSDWFHYQSLMFPLCLSENSDTLVLVSSPKAILYHLKDNRVELASSNEITWSFAKDYVESLASIC
ncbi:F-box protein interaction domain protein [Medicago truncatula]|uniref:F-box protein interaction domain protein n=1 Tax=Medicago truncatula TaxID=3880 RepID=A0A072TYT3_MEDTR|nr:F-box protein interaction domain protein [Medicago truncatula]